MDISVASLALVGVAALVLMVVVLAFMVWSSFRRQVRHLGYASVREYLAATPVSDEEKRDAVNLALNGMVICLLGLVFPPFLLVGLFPFFYGARKLACSSMGLGLVDDADQRTP